MSYLLRSRHQIESPDEKNRIHDTGSWSLIIPHHHIPQLPGQGVIPAYFRGRQSTPPDSRQHDANLDKDDEFIWLPPWKLGTLYHDGCHHHLLGKLTRLNYVCTPLYIIRSISWRGEITQNDPGPINWSGLALVSPDKNHVCRYSVLSRRIMQDFVITLIIRVMDFTIFHHWHLSTFHLPIYKLTFPFECYCSSRVILYRYMTITIRSTDDSPDQPAIAGLSGGSIGIGTVL